MQAVLPIPPLLPPPQPEPTLPSLPPSPQMTGLCSQVQHLQQQQQQMLQLFFNNDRQQRRQQQQQQIERSHADRYKPCFPPSNPYWNEEEKFLECWEQGLGQARLLAKRAGRKERRAAAKAKVDAAKAKAKVDAAKVAVAKAESAKVRAQALDSLLRVLYAS